MKHQTTSPGETPPETLPGRSSENGSVDTATLELLASWRIEDSTDNPDAIRAAEQEVAEFKKAINDNRTTSGEPLVYP